MIMIEVLCRNDNCSFCDQDGDTDHYIRYGVGYLEIDDDLTCESFSEVTDEVWGDEPIQFWIAARQDREPYRKLVRGRKVTVCGEVFYTRFDLRYKDKNILLTDPRTGYLLASPEVVEKNIETVRKRREGLPDVMTYPAKEDEP